MSKLYQIAGISFKQYRSIPIINILMKCYIVEIADEKNLLSLQIFSNLIIFVYEGKAYEIKELESIFVSNETRTELMDIFCFERDCPETFKFYRKIIYLSGRAKE